MTPGKLRRRVAHWQKVLAPLGVGHWKISVNIVEEPEGRRGSDAGVFIPNHYDTADMQVRRSFIEESTAHEIDCCIVHELVHLALRDLRFVADSASETLAPAVESLFDDTFDHEMEGVTDRFARALVALHDPDD